MQKVAFLGMEITDRTERESLRLADSFLHDGILDRILFLDRELLLAAEEDEKLQNYIKQAALTLWLDVKTAEIAGVNDRSRAREIKEFTFLMDFLHLLSRRHESVYLAAQNDSMLELMRQTLSVHFPEVLVVGSCILPEQMEEYDRVINGMNSAFPSVILASGPAALQADYLAYSKSMLNADVWLSAPRSIESFGIGNSLLQKGRQFFRLLLLGRKVRRYVQS